MEPKRAVGSRTRFTKPARGASARSSRTSSSRTSGRCPPTAAPGTSEAAGAEGLPRPRPLRLPRHPLPLGAARPDGGLVRPRPDLGPAEPSAGGGKAKLPIPGTGETSLAERLPEDLRGSAAELDFGSLPFTPLYRTDFEAAAEISNQTVHGVAHFAWAEQGEGRYQGQMAVYVKPRGRFGQGYMALIKPFRYLIVYPALMRQFERTWDDALAPSRG